jgi:hypothetical protein
MLKWSLIPITNSAVRPIKRAYNLLSPTDCGVFMSIYLFPFNDISCLYYLAKNGKMDEKRTRSKNKVDVKLNVRD